MKSISAKTQVLICLLALTLVFSAAFLPSQKSNAASKPWYGKYWEESKTAKKVVRISGSKIYLKGKWENTAKRSQLGNSKEKKTKKTFKLTGKTKYILEYTDSGKKKTVSKKTFRKHLYSDVTYCSIKVKSGKVVKAVLSFN